MDHLREAVLSTQSLDLQRNYFFQIHAAKVNNGPNAVQRPIKVQYQEKQIVLPCLTIGATG